MGKQVRVYFHFNRALKRSLMKVAECKIAAALKGHCAATTVKTALIFQEAKNFFLLSHCRNSTALSLSLLSNVQSVQSSLQFAHDRTSYGCL